jgi:Predicted methyltransferase regulatory domain/Methyltransferase domain
MNWTSGYVADLGYTAGFYRETAPSHMAFAALSIGRSPGRALHPKRILELGFGQGFGLSLLAAANPDIAFEGYDFNPGHVANTRRLIEGAGLANIIVSETSFEEAAARGGDNNLDVITLHGILSWVARPIQDAIIAIVRQRLQPDGLAYISYNCMPGWAPLAPIRQVMFEVKRRNPGRSERQLALALELITRLKQGNAAYFAANPAAAQHFDAMLRLDRAYLAHEYLHEHWDLFQFSDMAARMSEAKLSYLASATLPENLDHYAVPTDLQPLLAQTEDPELRETIRDFAANKRFRRDLFVRGNMALTASEHRRALSTLSFALAVPRSRVVFEFPGPLMVLPGREDLLLPIANSLAQKNLSFDELLALPSFGPGKIGILLDCLALLVHSGQAVPIATAKVDVEPAQRFNRMIVGHSRTGRIYQYLAAPVARTGIPVTDFGLLALAGILDGKTELAAVAKHAMSILRVLGQRPMRGGVLIEGEGEATSFLAEQMQPIVDDYVPLWRRLGVL